MLKKVLFTLAIVLSTPVALVNCAASGSAGVGEEGASGSASGRVGEGASSSTTTDTQD